MKGIYETLFKHFLKNFYGWVLGITKKTVQSFIDLFLSTHLIYKLLPFGYGKEVLRGRSKIYLSDPAIASALLLKGKMTLENPFTLGQCVETSVIAHLLSHCRSSPARFSYWRSPKEKKEIDLVVELDGILVPIEVKYQAEKAQLRDVPGLIELMKKKKITQGYIVTKTPSDLDQIKLDSLEKAMIGKIPACLLCFYLGQGEFQQKNILSW